MLSLLFLWAFCAVAFGDECFGGGLFSSMSGTPKCYHFFMSTQPYDEAAAVCYSIGGTLVSIGSQLEEMFIVSSSHEKLAITDYWIGLTNILDGTWRWDDQSPYGYSNWATDASKDDPSKNCVTGRLNTGKWFNLDCGEARNFVCESEPLSFPVETAPTKHCATFTADGRLFDKCYLGVDSEQTYEQAEIICENLGGLVVSILNSTELVLVTGLAKAVLSRKDYWIGLDRLFDGTNWQWSDGDTFDTKNFSNWSPGFPTSKSGENCAMALSANSKWENKACNMALTFICEVKPIVVSTSGTSSPLLPTCPACPASGSCPTCPTSTVCPTCPAPKVCPTTTTTNCSGPTDRDWMYYPPGDSLYHIIGYSEFNGDWFDAYETKCVAMGAHLPSIHSYAELYFVAGLGAGNGVPIGFHSTTDVNGFQWSDGSDSGFRVWESQPTADKLCALVYYGGNGFLPFQCTYSTSFTIVCKKPYA